MKEKEVNSLSSTKANERNNFGEAFVNLNMHMLTDTPRSKTVAFLSIIFMIF